MISQNDFCELVIGKDGQDDVWEFVIGGTYLLGPCKCNSRPSGRGRPAPPAMGPRQCTLVPTKAGVGFQRNVPLFSETFCEICIAFFEIKRRVITPRGAKQSLLL